MGIKREFVPFMFSSSLFFGLTYFRRKSYSTPSKIFLFGALMSPNVCSTSFRKCAWKRSTFFASVVFGCILRIVWNMSSKSSNFSFLPSKINLFVDSGFRIVAAYDRGWVEIPAIASTRQLMELF